jgi:hypothetical protein
MKPKIPSWLAQVISLVLMLAGFGPLAAGALYQIVSGGSIDLLYYLPCVAVFVLGLLIFAWDRQKHGPIPRPTKAESAVLYYRMAIAFLGLFAAAVGIAVVWGTVLQGTWLWYSLSVLVGAGLWGAVFSVWGYYKVGGSLAMRETLRQEDRQ